MVRLVITDFASKEDNEAFYLNDEFESQKQLFTYHRFKKHSVYLSKYETNDDIYSLNLLSKKYLEKNQFLIHITNKEFIILFNHKTVYYAKVNSNFITDDMIKSILITKHIAMLSSGGDIDKIYYVINSKYKSAIENILKQNTRNEKGLVIAQSLGEIKDLIKPLIELDSVKTHTIKSAYLITFILGIAWVLFFGLDILSNKFIDNTSFEQIKNELRVQKRFESRQKRLYNKSLKEYENLVSCMSNKDTKNDKH